MQTLLAFIFAILILVSLHEFGHYIVARLCGVKVVRFSVGFGKPFFSRKRGDTEWCLAPIPLGGYVKMVDTREGEVAQADLPYGVNVGEWEKAQQEIVLNIESGKVNVAVQTTSGQEAMRIIDAAGTPEAGKIAKNQGYIGLSPFKITTRVGEVTENSPAEKAGLKKGDKLISADGQDIESWQQWVEIVRQSPGKKIGLSYERDGKTFQTTIRPDSIQQPDKTLVGRVGFGPQGDEAWAKEIKREYKPSVAEAFAMGWDKTVNNAWMTVKFFGKLITGNASLNHISGPLTIADVAGKTAQLGFQSYLEFLALVSISLGVLNLLPIPVLDGGHLVFYTAEWIRGKPLSERIQAIGLRLGLAAMLLMMALAFFNDINRLFG